MFQTTFLPFQYMEGTTFGHKKKPILWVRMLIFVTYNAYR